MSRLYLQPVFVICALLLCVSASHKVLAANPHWFEDFKQNASREELYVFLYNMPKGGDLHNHLSGSSLPIWWYETALAEAERGYEYYTKVQINNCQVHNKPGSYLLLFQNLLKQHWQQLDACEQGEYRRLRDLDANEKTAWLNSIELDRAGEGRREFFETHWQRLNDLRLNPYLMAELLVRNMQAFGDEGLLYLETQAGATGFQKPDGSLFEPDVVVALYQARLAEPDATATGVTVRLQEAILRFAPMAEEHLIYAYNFVATHPDLYVGLNMVGREDDGKGYPGRFLAVLRKLRKNRDVPLSIHAGEVDEPNYHVRDTLLLGAKRIGHGLNLITDNATMLRMQHGPYLIEINLISNLLLEYVDNYQEHPFPEYLRTGIPVALSTDDRGMWNSNMTDEFFVAVTEFNLTWQEITQLTRNSIAYGFMEEPVKRQLLDTLEAKLRKFERQFLTGSLSRVSKKTPERYAFLCRHYNFCTDDLP